MSLDDTKADKEVERLAIDGCMSIEAAARLAGKIEGLKKAERIARTQVGNALFRADLHSNPDLVKQHSEQANGCQLVLDAIRAKIAELKATIKEEREG